MIEIIWKKLNRARSPVPGQSGEEPIELKLAIKNKMKAINLNTLACQRFSIETFGSKSGA